MRIFFLRWQRIFFADQVGGFRLAGGGVFCFVGWSMR
jgi:hypothetical protein